MELRYDWVHFANTFYPVSKEGVGAGRISEFPLIAVVEKGVVVTAVSEDEDLTDWVGASCDEFKAHFQHREVVFLERKDFEKWLKEADRFSHFYSQMAFLKKKILEIKANRKSFHSKNNFLLHALEGWWGRVLPSSFGVLVRVHSEETQALEDQTFSDSLFIFQRGELQLYHRPDICLRNGEENSLAEAVKYLSEKHSVGVQGVSVRKNDWEKWCNTPDPWKQVALAIRSNQAELVPFRWSLVSLIATRGFIGI